MIKSEIIEDADERQRLNKLEEKIREKTKPIIEWAKNQLFSKHIFEGVDCGYEDPWDVAWGTHYGPGILVIKCPSSVGYEEEMVGWSFGIDYRWNDGVVRAPGGTLYNWTDRVWTGDPEEVERRIQLIDDQKEEFIFHLKRQVNAYLKDNKVYPR